MSACTSRPSGQPVCGRCTPVTPRSSCGPRWAPATAADETVRRVAGRGAHADLHPGHHLTGRTRSVEQREHGEDHQHGVAPGVQHRSAWPTRPQRAHGGCRPCARATDEQRERSEHHQSGECRPRRDELSDQATDRDLDHGTTGMIQPGRRGAACDGHPPAAIFDPPATTKAIDATDATTATSSTAATDRSEFDDEALARRRPRHPSSAHSRSPPQRGRP